MHCGIFSADTRARCTVIFKRNLFSLRRHPRKRMGKKIFTMTETLHLSRGKASSNPWLLLPAFGRWL